MTCKDKERPFIAFYNLLAPGSSWIIINVYCVYATCVAKAYNTIRRDHQLKIIIATVLIARNPLKINGIYIEGQIRNIFQLLFFIVHTF